MPFRINDIGRSLHEARFEDKHGSSLSGSGWGDPVWGWAPRPHSVFNRVGEVDFTAVTVVPRWFVPYVRR